MSEDKDARIAELERKLEHMSKLATPADYVVYENKCMKQKIAELERKLAEQQAVLISNRECMEYMLDICINIHKVDFPQTQRLLAKDISAEELNKLLAKAREEEREACAVWYAEKGWLMDEDDVADAMRNRPR